MSAAIPPPNPRRPTESRLRALRQDVMAGIINAAVSVPDGLASAALAGTNPVYGLYTSVFAPITGGLLMSAQLMQIATTSASALVAAEAIRSFPAAQRDPALFLLVFLVGLFLAAFGLLRLGRLVRFVSHAVMTGFLMGVAVVLILDQFALLVGVAPRGQNEIIQFVDVLSHWRQFSLPTLITGALALGISIGLNRTRFRNVSSLLALVVPSVLVAIMGWENVQRVADINPIPRGLPMMTLPDISLLTPRLLLAAFALAVVIAVQGAGVSQTVENPDGTRVRPSRDMIAQGAANVASGLFSGIPAGGSVGQTALNVSVGARSRWAAVLGGLWMVVFVLLAPGLVGRVPMAVLGAVMILAGVSAINVREARSIWMTGGASRLAILVTFLATLVLSMPLAVGCGVLLSLLLYIFSSAGDVKVLALVPIGNGRFEERKPPERLPGNAVTLLDVYGSLFFAGARMLQQALPNPKEVARPVVVLRLHGRTRIGATLIEVLDDYADDLADAGGRLYLSGVDEDVAVLLRRTGKLDLDNAVHIVPARPVLGAATEEAVALAEAWLGSKRTKPETR